VILGVVGSCRGRNIYTWVRDSTCCVSLCPGTLPLKSTDHVLNIHHRHVSRGKP
jgi:hypothetical protein